MIFYKWFYNIFKVIFTYNVLSFLVKLCISNVTAVFIMSLFILPIFTLCFCFGQDFINYKWNTLRNWFDLMITFIFGYKPENYKYKVDEIIYNDKRSEYYPRIKTTLITPYYYLEQRNQWTNKFDFELNKPIPYKTESAAAYILTKHKNYIEKQNKQKKKEKNEKTIREKRSTIFTFKK